MGLDWLDVVKGRHLGGAADRGIREVAVCGSVDFGNERGEEDIHAQTLHADEAASKLTLMGTETVEGVAKGGTWRHSRTRTRLPFMAMTAEPEPRMGANELLPMRTRRPVTDR